MAPLKIRFTLKVKFTLKVNLRAPYILGTHLPFILINIVIYNWKSSKYGQPVNGWPIDSVGVKRLKVSK